MFIEKTNIQFDHKTLVQATEQIINSESYKSNFDQICFTGRNSHDSFLTGAGSLYYRYENNDRQLRESPLSENEFVSFLDEFKDTYFYEIYKQLDESYNIGRMRLMTMSPKSIYTFHQDQNKRLHFAIIGNDEECGYLANEQVHRIPYDGCGFILDTTIPHTAFNTSYCNNRTNLVIDLLEIN